MTLLVHICNHDLKPAMKEIAKVMVVHIGGIAWLQTHQTQQHMEPWNKRRHISAERTIVTTPSGAHSSKCQYNECVTVHVGYR